MNTPEEIPSLPAPRAYVKYVPHDCRRRNNLTPEQRTRIGRLGGLAVSSIPGHMAELGRKGGKKLSIDRDHMAKIGRKGGSK